jgi:hypothetical protein
VQKKSRQPPSQGKGILALFQTLCVQALGCFFRFETYALLVRLGGYLDLYCAPNQPNQKIMPD